MSFGTQLRAERERRGIALAAIADHTKVAIRYLQALEDDAPDQLPGGIFNKGIVRGYCRHLSLDEEEWLQRFALTVEPVHSEPDWNTFAENVRRNRELTGASRARWWGVLLMLAALLALGWLAWRYVLKPRLQPVTQGTLLLPHPDGTDVSAR